MQRAVRASVLAGLALAGCEEHGRSPAADASIDTPLVVTVDAPRPRNDPGMGPFQQPFDATFVTPAGTFEAHTLFASAIWGDCNPPFWELRFAPGKTGQESTLTLQVSLPPYAGVEVSGTMPASAYYQSAEPLFSHSTQNVTFEATRIDYPADGAPRITGRFTESDPAWTFDLTIDILGISSGCI